ncbi:histone-lysine N-methyltransferase SETMAR-like [Cardiocondyla obscurior]|uniref:histone-lysine N-methyltransferase SETMAR-like n=1 Tax=Cardiocondyla obscurior TaxID=286306 RepID=UPI00396574EB
MEKYSYEELTDIILIYGECQRNQRQAAALYANRFPDRRRVDNGFFHRLCERSKTNGQFYKSRRPIHVPKRNREVIGAVQEAVVTNPHTSTRAIARDLNMFYVAVHKTIKYSLNMHPFKRHTSQKLTLEDMDQRLNFCEWIINHVNFNDAENDPFLKNILWTDEAVFRKNGYINRQNEHHYAENNPRCIKEINIQDRWTVNVWLGIIGDHVIGPEFIQGYVNAEYYSEFLLNRLNDLLEDVPLAQRLEMRFQQDGHPAHTSRLARNILREKFSEKWIGLYGPQEWPPRSPDLTPLDFFAWGYLKNKVYKNEPENAEELKQRIRDACSEIIPRTLKQVRENFMRRVAICLEKNGGHIEHLL